MPLSLIALVHRELTMTLGDRCRRFSAISVVFFFQTGAGPPSLFRGQISHGLIAAVLLKSGRPDVGVEPKESSHGDVCWIRRVARGNHRLHPRQGRDANFRGKGGVEAGTLHKGREQELVWRLVTRLLGLGRIGTVSIIHACHDRSNAD